MLSRKMLAAVIIMIAPMSATACASFSVQGNARCAVSAENPHNSKGTPSDIVGKSRFGCDTSIDSVTNIVRIEQSVNGRWTSVAQAERTVNRPAAGAQYTNQAALPCRKGQFRTASSGYGYYHGVKSQSSAWEYSQTVTNPCG